MLSKRYRLHKHGSFTYVYNKGAGKSDGPLKITYVRCRGVPKIGISVPNTVGKAVVRNKVRRRIRAALYPLTSRIKGAQIVFSARKGADALTYAQIERSLYTLLGRVGLL
ncbi:MAG: ribonuclease P protein component [Clostridiales bacterium]|nr:ribonuclease P protein component [Clostridiales bacterium]